MEGGIGPVISRSARKLAVHLIYQKKENLPGLILGALPAHLEGNYLFWVSLQTDP